MSDPTNPNPLPQPTIGSTNRLHAPDGNGAAQDAPGSTQTAPAVPQTIASVEDVLTWLSAIFPTVVIAVSRKRLGAAAGAKPASVQVLHAGDAAEALKLASVAAGVLQGA